MSRSVLDRTSSDQPSCSGSARMETSPLLHDQTSAVLSYGARPAEPFIDPQEHPASTTRHPSATWRLETRRIAAWSVPLLLGHFLQRAINFSSVFIVGRLGTQELGAVSLASITTNMIGNTIIQGLANSLDTLAAQAYGSGNKHLLGIHAQRMVYFILLVTSPLMAVWWKADEILALIVPDRQLADLAGLYLKIMMLRVPAFVLFDCGKRYTQAQGILYPATHVLLITTPINAGMMWTFVWYFDWGFVGGPIAIVITENLMAVLLFLYMWLVDGHQCWGGLSRKAFSNWEPMVRLAIPGMVMHVAESAAEEILTIACAQFGAAQLAAHSALVALTQLLWTVPFAISIAASIRIANLIGARATEVAKMVAVVAVILGFIVIVLNTVLMAALRHQIPRLFTDDVEVIGIIVKALPIVMIMQCFDATAALSHGLLRGIGSQKFGGYVCLATYNLVAIPISFTTAFLFHWQIYGLWTGFTTGLFIVTMVEFWWLYRSNWDDALKEAERRNELD